MASSLFVCENCFTAYTHEVAQCTCGGPVTDTNYCPAAVLNSAQIRLIHLNRAYDDLQRQTKKLEFLLDDSLLPGNVRITGNALIDRLHGKVEEKEIQKQFYVAEGIKLREDNSLAQDKIRLLEGRINTLMLEKQQLRKKNRKRMGWLMFLIVMLLGMFIYGAVMLQKSGLDWELFFFEH
jgi:hypothetical protein